MNNGTIRIHYFFWESREKKKERDELFTVLGVLLFMNLSFFSEERGVTNSTNKKKKKKKKPHCGEYRFKLKFPDLTTVY